MKKWSEYSKGTLALFAVLLLIFPLTWFILDATNFLSHLDLIVDESPGKWSSLFLNYYGSAFAAVAGYIAVIITIHQQEKSRKEDKAKEVLPLIAVDIYGGSMVDYITITNENCDVARLNPDLCGELKIKNVGMREMYNLEVANMKSAFFEDIKSPIPITPILYKDATQTIRIFPIIKWDLKENGGDKELHAMKQIIKIKPNTSPEVKVDVLITFAYEDCYKNKYTQDFKITLINKVNPYQKHEIPDILLNKIEVQQCEVISAPKPK